jgi:hypothetical protein
MKRIAVVAGVVVLCALGGMGCATEQRATRVTAADSLAMITNNEVIALSRAGISDSVIVAMMKAKGTSFRLGTSDVIALADSGVSQDVISAMIARGEQPKLPAAAVTPGVYRSYYWYGYDPFSWPWYPGPYYGVRFGFGFPYYRYHGFFHGGFGIRGRRR